MNNDGMSKYNEEVQSGPSLILNRDKVMQVYNTYNILNLRIID